MIDTSTLVRPARTLTDAAIEYGEAYGPLIHNLNDAERSKAKIEVILSITTNYSGAVTVEFTVSDGDYPGVKARGQNLDAVIDEFKRRAGWDETYKAKPLPVLISGPSDDEAEDLDNTASNPEPVF
jgi:hypothetical protein